MVDLLVVDANIIISALINKGIAWKIFIENARHRRFDLIAPEFLLEEIKKHESKILKYTKLSNAEFEIAYRFFMDEIIQIPESEFSDFMERASEIAPHAKDITYVALSLFADCPILSGDKGLQNSPAHVHAPRMILDMLERS